ncbi:MAG: hypothetical protein IH863_07035 [Chloroflexi bacterium]|nr:hypothetical protein [Chloroflexota bacterium]
MRVVLPAGLAVAFVAIVVAGVLGSDRATAPSPSGSPEPSGDAAVPPRMGEDHWHATFEYIVCDELQPLAPTFEGAGVHTHGDGIMHIHPFTPSEEGVGARLVKWFEYGGGLLDDDEVRMPGSAETYKNGEECPDGTIGTVQIFANGSRIQDYEKYIPKDGDRIVIVFGPERSAVRRTLTDTPARLY